LLDVSLSGFDPTATFETMSLASILPSSTVLLGLVLGYDAFVMDGRYRHALIQELLQQGKGTTSETA
jgi:hypothetical protein